MAFAGNQPVQHCLLQQCRTGRLSLSITTLSPFYTTLATLNNTITQLSIDDKAANSLAIIIESKSAVFR